MTSRAFEAVRNSRVSSGDATKGKPRKHGNGNDVSTVSERKLGRANRGYVLEDQVGFQLRLAMQRHTAIFVSEMTLTQTQFATIVKLNEVGACSQNHLARLVALDAATVNGVLERLRRRGYVSTQPDLHDARQRVISITSAGRKKVERTVKIAKKITAATLAPLSLAERAELSRLLVKIS
jgi:DNA-binding MarR family transcriptional regulator